ncbi:Trypanosome variant surface glycoprotein (A-type) [Trypanosoma brucei equiperdum]|uniref:Trypanosome variant surface glycoprotein (A-type) n=1 Tax=Trypanosoma brucei equiperdum TaxID=630700 RepID=A0A3L6L1B3_9TRYP|nr:Trypanosome variant surface glycoprotein (A-type) [Trypanosoma brucei equiperdum]RHW70403.1 Trypanosome variant surface glycoprotein (A-type) [Trypanosoma brucei equiperdum]RHW70426.1 Trypanosome variant surface glycoprotein (A-type) [Trypanosoma brucei equiperdum]RHW70604.1 Trypanosome variant surface glycoprotein (A-type) [Trypanosoma brucei equiperdum]
MAALRAVLSPALICFVLSTAKGAKETLDATTHIKPICAASGKLKALELYIAQKLAAGRQAATTLSARRPTFALYAMSTESQTDKANCRLVASYIDQKAYTVLNDMANTFEEALKAAGAAHYAAGVIDGAIETLASESSSDEHCLTKSDGEAAADSTDLAGCNTKTEDYTNLQEHWETQTAKQTLGAITTQADIIVASSSDKCALWTGGSNLNSETAQTVIWAGGTIAFAAASEDTVQRRQITSSNTPKIFPTISLIDELRSKISANN